MFDGETDMLIRVSDYSNCPGICNIRHFIRMQYMHSDVVLRSRIFLVAAFRKLIEFCGRRMFPTVCRR